MKKLCCLALAVIITVGLFAGCSVQNDVSRIVEERFVLPCEGHDLNAVYTYIDDGEKHPTVLMIAGSGPADCDETVRALKPFADIAKGLADNGINSIRFDKRSLYGNLGAKDGIEEEYLEDSRKAMEYIKSAESAGDIYLLGHSLGGQIIAEFAKEYPDEVKGLIVYNSTARNLVVLGCDQHIRQDPESEASYISIRDAALSTTRENAKGYSYFGILDYYWASINELDTIGSLKELKLPTLIINSTFDRNMFPADLELWQEEFADDDNVQIIVDDKISHFGYEQDAFDPDAFFAEDELPKRIIDYFATFINNGEAGLQ